MSWSLPGHPHLLSSGRPWSPPNLWVSSHGNVEPEAGSSERTEVVETFFKHGILTHGNGAALIEGMVERGLGAECRQQVTCAHPILLFCPHSSPCEATFSGHHLSTTVTKEINVFWVGQHRQGHPSRTACLITWLQMPHHTWQSEFSGEWRWTSLKGDVDRRRALESEDLGSSLDSDTY